LTSGCRPRCTGRPCHAAWRGCLLGRGLDENMQQEAEERQATEYHEVDPPLDIEHRAPSRPASNSANGQRTLTAPLHVGKGARSAVWRTAGSHDRDLTRGVWSREPLRHGVVPACSRGSPKPHRTSNTASLHESCDDLKVTACRGPRGRLIAPAPSRTVGPGRLTTLTAELAQILSERGTPWATVRGKKDVRS
jgi:hypothetical protein